MTAETTLPGRVVDPETAIYSAAPRAAHSHPSGVHMIYVDPNPSTESLPFSRKDKRVTETREIQIRTTHVRRKMFSRGGVLVGFVLAMVVYPIMGNIVSYGSGAAGVPGVVVGEAPTTGHALLGDGPRLIPTTIAPPSQEETVTALLDSPITLTVSAFLPNCLPPAEYHGENGLLAPDQLCLLWNGTDYLRADAALAAAALNDQFKAKFGRDLCLEQGYRTYDEQVAIKARRGYLAAPPGKSMHGFGFAMDLCRGDYTGEAGEWLDANAATFGFENPAWAKSRTYEPWHWEYFPGVNSTGANTEGSEYWTGDGVADMGGTATPEPTPAATPAADAANQPASS